MRRKGSRARKGSRPITVNGKVPPRRLPNAERRPREYLTRRKNGRPSVHLLRGQEIRALRRLKREQVPESAYVFTSERRGPLTPATFRKMLATVGAVAELPFPVHPHMLRHACGYKLAHDGHDTRALQEWLGHCNIQNTTRYTEPHQPPVQGLLAAGGLTNICILYRDIRNT